MFKILRMKKRILHIFLTTSLFLAGVTSSFAQREIGLRPIFFQNDFSNPEGIIDGAYQGIHAGEWSFGVSKRRFFAPHFAGRSEVNFVTGRYPFTSKRFSYLNFCVIPEWRITKRVFTGYGAFINARIKDPFSTVDPVEMGVLACLGFRHDKIEIQSRLQYWAAPGGKFTFGAGLDYCFETKKAARKKQKNANKPGTEKMPLQDH